MKKKLYDGGWVELSGHGPQLVTATEGGLKILTFFYDENGRPIKGTKAPEILLIYSYGCFRQAS